MKIKKNWAAILTVFGLALSMAGCGSTTTGASAGTSETTTLYGQITAIDGTAVTLALAQQRTEGSTPSGGQGQDGASMPDKPTGDSAGQPPDAVSGSTVAPKDDSGQAPSGAAPSGQPSEMPSGGDGKGGPGVSLTGETKTITLSDSTLYTVNGASGSQSDLAVGSVVTVEMQGDKVVSVTVENTGAGKMGKPDESASGAASGETLANGADLAETPSLTTLAMTDITNGMTV